jgi:hypothetical protein
VEPEGPVLRETGPGITVDDFRAAMQRELTIALG